MINDGERLDDLNLDGLKIIQKVGGYGFTSDSVLLANFVKTKKSDTVLEIGAGSGIISILVNYKEKPKKIYAFEIQEEAANLAKRNFELNNMQNQIEVVNLPIQKFKQVLTDGQIDVVFCNPPYFKYDESVCGEQEEKIISRFDKCLPVCDLFEYSAKLLKFGGKMFFVYPSSRQAECFAEMKKHNIAPKRIYFVHPNTSKNSTVFLCEAVKGAKEGLIVMPPLFANDLDGNYVQTIQKLYKK